MTHVINRLQFELNCSDEDQAFNFRENFAISFYEQLAEVADEICSKHVSDKEWLQIDKLEIDLGRFSPSSFDADFATIFKAGFEKELSQLLAAISPAEKKSSVQFSEATLFKYFLLTGMLPWWVDETSIDFNAIIFNVLINQPAIAKRFFYNNRDKRNVWLRVSFQLNVQAKTQIILLIEELNEAKDIFILWLLQLNDLLVKENNKTLNTSLFSIDDELLKHAPPIFDSHQNSNELLQVFQTCSNENFSTENIIIGNILNNNKKIFIESADKINATQLSLADVYQDIKINEDVINGAISFNDNNIYDEEDSTNKYAVKHAGIILLAPFLKPFFTNLNLLVDSNWQTKDAQYKAVHLLKFLCTGIQQTPEYNLTLEKIICGLNIKEPIPQEIILSEEEKNEAMVLLESVIEHWKALKSTSVNGLRETYLKRDGLLIKKDNGWLLQVERKTLDVLIDSIPWGYSTINFSWSDDTILIEW